MTVVGKVADQAMWILALETANVSKGVAARWARIKMDPDRASKIRRGLLRKGVNPGCMSGLARAVRRYLLDAGRWREVSGAGKAKPYG